MTTPPIPSARERTLPKTLTYPLTLYIAVLCVGLFKNPLSTVFFMATAFGILCCLFSLMRACAAMTRKPPPSRLMENGPNSPSIAILLPVYHEAHMIEALLTNILKTDYPLAKLAIIIVCEPDDDDTIRAAQAAITARQNGPLRLFITNGTGPKTKPNALNQALAITNNDIVTVYDAEDRPHPQQLRAAAYALSVESSLAVVQAPLTYYNSGHNWLTRQFTLEYAALFQAWVPFLSRLGFPFPLGGTSNHIRRTALDSVGGWDAYNVTEDADLSFRFAAHGWTLGYITPPTYEEAVSTLSQWGRQRSRWMKGYMQTWLTHMKHPVRPGGKKGAARFFTLQITIGVTLIAGLFHVPGLCLFLCVAFYNWAQGDAGVPLTILSYSLIFSYAAGLLIGAVGAARIGKPSLILSTLWMPAYWLMLLFPTGSALLDLKRRPFHWHKTEHGDRDAAEPPHSTQHQAPANVPAT